MLAPQIILKVRPNNQISLTVGNFRKKLPAVSQFHTHLDDQIHPWQIKAKQEQMQKAVDRHNELIQIYKYRLRPPLDIISKSQRGKKYLPKSPNKPKNFSRHSGQKVRESGSAMAIACNGDHQKCREVTLTLPANHIKAFQALAYYSGEVINKLFQPIRRHWGLDAHWFFVWEYQERGALHLHIGIYHHEQDECDRMASKLIEQWHDVLCSISDWTGICMFTAKQGDRCTIRTKHQHHTAPIEKDIGRYFSKYAGKEESKNTWYVKKYPVSRFWGSSKKIKQIVRENSFECSWDYFASEASKEEKLTQIIENILAKIAIVSSSSYDFDIKLAGKRRLNRYQNGRKILVTDEEKSIANGTRYTFYCEQNDFQEALASARHEKGIF